MGQATRAPIAITLFVKNPNANHEGCHINYLDIGDYLAREQKLHRIRQASSVNRVEQWNTIEPDENFDWLNLSDPTFLKHSAIGDDATRAFRSNKAVFRSYSNGIKTNRDMWLYGFDHIDLAARISRMVDTYTESMEKFASGEDLSSVTMARPNMIKWDGSLIQRLKQRKTATFETDGFRLSTYRPFTKQYVYFDPLFINSVYRVPSFFPVPQADNTTVHLPGPGGAKPFSAVAADATPDLHLVEGGQSFPKYSFEVLETELDSAPPPPPPHLEQTGQLQSEEWEATGRSRRSYATQRQNFNSSRTGKSFRGTPTRRSTMRSRSNIAISVAGVGANKPFSAFITDIVPDLELVTKGQVFPRYTFEEVSDVR